MLAFYKGNGSTPRGGTPEYLGDFMKRERAKYERVVKISGAKVD